MADIVILILIALGLSVAGAFLGYQKSQGNGCCGSCSTCSSKCSSVAKEEKADDK